MNLPENTAKLLSYLGLIPFIFSSLLIWSPKYQEYAHDSLAIYAAIILTFIGAVHWGIVISSETISRSTARLCLSVIPALISWLVLLTSANYILPLLSACFIVFFWLEQLLMDDLMPNWYVKLRNRLSFFVVTLLLFGWIGLLQ